MIKVGDALPAVTLSEYIEVEGNGCSIGPNPVEVQKAAAGKTIRIDNHYRVNATGITVLGGTNVVFGTNGKISLMPHNATEYQILRVHDVTSAVTVTGAVIDGRRDLNAATTGEHGMGISVRGCGARVSLVSCQTINCWGDGLYVAGSSNGGLAYCTDVYTSDHYSYNNRRQGRSLISALSFVADDPQWIGTAGTNPQAGLDIEPNSGTDRLDYVEINRPVTGDNTGSGIIVALINYDGATRDVDIRITDHVDDGSRGGFSVLGTDFGANVTGTIRTTNPIWRNNGFAGFGADR